MVQTATILQDSLFFVKNFLLTNLTDPIASSRPSTEKFIMTSYPQRPVRYPLITVKDMNSYSIMRSGFQSTITQHYVEIEVRIWARDIKEKDNLADAIFQKLKDNQFTSSTGQTANFLHDFQLMSSVNVDEVDGPKSKVMTFKFLFVAT